MYQHLPLAILICCVSAFFLVGMQMLTPVGCAGGYKWHMHDKGVLWMGQEDDIGFADWRFEGMAVWR